MKLLVTDNLVSDLSQLDSFNINLEKISITTLAATAGAILPLLFDRMKLDPALMSSPFITTVTDIAGVFIYLSTAKWLLNSSLA